MAPSKKNTCSTCKKTFDRAERLVAHTKKCGGNIKCRTCGTRFPSREKLQRHQAKAVEVQCDHCLRIFCSGDGLEQHKRTIHSTLRHDPEYSLDTPICPKTGYEGETGYRSEVFRHRNMIRNYMDKRARYTIINKEIEPEFTYRELRAWISDEIGTRACKVNLGFGFILHHGIEDTYRYHYVSSNTLLFEKAVQISTNPDFNNFFQRIIDLDLINNYYLKKPS